jgi:hypothetical protein
MDCRECGGVAGADLLPLFTRDTESVWRAAFGGRSYFKGGCGGRPGAVTGVSGSCDNNIGNVSETDRSWRNGKAQWAGMFADVQHGAQNDSVGSLGLIVGRAVVSAGA